MSATKREGIVYGLPEAEYHAPKDELSSSRAKLILQSPAKLKHDLDKTEQEYKAAYDVGTAVHTKLLGVGSDFVLYPKEHLTASGAASTKAETVEWVKKQKQAGLTVVTPNESKSVDAMAEAVLAHPLARKLFEREGNPEVSVFAEVLDVKNRARFDYLPNEGGIAVDIKTTLDASPSGFARSAAKFGYHIQRGHYLDVLKRASGRDVEMLFVTVEKDAPHLVGVHQLNQEFADMGVAEALEARDIFSRCRESGEWPGYPMKVHLLQPPMYAVYAYQDRYGEQGQ